MKKPGGQTLNTQWFKIKQENKIEWATQHTQEYRSRLVLRFFNHNKVGLQEEENLNGFIRMACF